jgi:hypothetical protein
MKNLGTAHGLFKPTSTLHPTLFALDQNLNQYYQAENVAQMHL